VGLMIVWWLMTRRIRWSWLRNMLRVTALVALLMPYPVPGQEGFLAPALMNTFVEGLFYEEYGFANAGVPLLLAIVIANIIYLIVDLAWQAWRRRHKGHEAQAVSESD